MKLFNKSKKIRIVSILFVVISLFLSFSQNMSYINIEGNESPNVLSEMSEEECINFVVNNGIEIPQKYEGKDFLGELIKNIIVNVEDNPNYPFSYNYDKLYNFAEEIRDLVNEYYGITENLLMPLNEIVEDHTLVDSLVYSNGLWMSNNGDWDDKWSNYNCYAYAINRIEQPLFYSDTFGQYQPGDFSKEGSFSTIEKTEDLANLIRLDLETIGYRNVITTTTRPESIAENSELICVRTGLGDYHFMRYDKDSGEWFHKPGNTAVLKYKYQPSFSKRWICEYSFRGKEYEDRTTGYDCSIYYIMYDINVIDLDSNEYVDLASKDISAGCDTIYKLNVKSELSYDFKVSSSLPVDVDLYDGNMDLIAITKKSNDNGNVVGFTNLLKTGVYYLRICYAYETYFGTINISLGHTHAKTFIRYYDGMRHTIRCNCGYSYNETHYITYEDANDGDKEGTCLGCNRILDLTTDIANIMNPQNNNKIKYSLNGSFILPSGIVVLVDIDIEAYISGTLIFYNKDELPSIA